MDSSYRDIKERAYTRWRGFQSIVIVVCIACIAFLLLMKYPEGIEASDYALLSSLRHDRKTIGEISKNYYYNKDNQLVKWFAVDANGELVVIDWGDGVEYHSAESEYVDGKEIAWTRYSDEESIRREYNKQGALAIVIKENIYGIQKWFYNESGQPAREEFYDTKGNPRAYSTTGAYVIIFHYSEEGHEQRFYNKAGQHIRTEFYDTNGNPRVDSDWNSFALDYMYDEESSELTSIIHYDIDGNIIGTLEKTEQETNEHPETNTLRHKTKIITTGDVYVRFGPGKIYDSFGIAEKGEELEYKEITEKDNSGKLWYNVVFKGQSGWVSADFAEIYPVNVIIVGSQD